ncbi:tail fiber protein [Plebeiibacterium sediminum]|uniref:Tail fiber protein n=1 Tax=Plebeiibacterium sediminum TaxID=2992112 RepID=A0AAE3M8S3_9BACT|nr:tail fiber protein [Plebeiobacterium sediminum]MCW3789173.1 tail fiber protein [Plebeiobacterium sediminum]
MQKSIFTLVAIMLFSTMSLMAQSSKGFSFQGYARGADGSALQNESNLEVRFTIFSTDENNPEFTENQTLSTDEFGVFQAVIGTTNSSLFNALNFAQNDYSLKVEIRDGGSYQQVARQSLLAVPYAKASEKAVEATSADNGVPPGSIMPFAGSSVPEGWLLCDGSEVDRDTYSKLFAAIGTAWGYGNMSSTFNLPELRGQFLRGVSGDSNYDPDKGSRTAYNGGNSGNKVGSYQGSQFASHNHAASSSNAGNHRHTSYDYYWYDAGSDDDYGTPTGDGTGERRSTSRNTAYAGEHNHNITVNDTGGNETRPRNAYVNYIIKY